MKKTIIVTAAAVSIMALSLGGMYVASQADNGDINLTDSPVAQTVMSAYQWSEDTAVNAWHKTENFFLDITE